MSEGKFTPGPLTVKPRGRLVAGPFVEYVNGTAQAQFASINSWVTEDGMECQQANAERVALCWNSHSALLEALQGTVDTIAGLNCDCSIAERASGHKTECGIPAAMEAVDKARAAIALALAGGQK